MYKVQKDMQLPKVQRKNAGRARKYPFAEMNVGEGFFAPGAKRASISTYMSRMGKALNREFGAVACTMKKNHQDKWVEADPQEPGAVAGVAVKRIS